MFSDDLFVERMLFLNNNFKCNTLEIPLFHGHPKYIQPYNNDGIHHFTNLGPVYMEVGDP